MEAFKDNIVDGMIYTLHFQRFPAVAAHSMITQMMEADACTLQYVEGLYQMMERKMFSLKKPHLLDMPDQFLENVVRELDGVSRAIVRKSCEKLRVLVDTQPIRLDNLTVKSHVTPKSISLRFSGLVVTYFEKKNGCLIKRSGGRKKFINDGKMEELALTDLKSLFINPKLEIGTLAIAKTNYYKFWPTFREFAQMLSSLEHQLHVEHFKWEIYYNTEDLVKILNAMKPSTLSSLTSNIVDWRRQIKSLRLNEQIFSLPQWKGVKKLDCTCIIDRNDFIHLAHMNKVILRKVNHTNHGEDTGERIMAIKDKLLENEKFNQIIIREHHGLIPVQDLEPILRPFQSLTDPRWSQFDYPNSDKKLLLRVYLYHIWFKGPCYEHNEDEARRNGLFVYDEEEEENEEENEEEDEGLSEEDENENGRDDEIEVETEDDDSSEEE